MTNDSVTQCMEVCILSEEDAAILRMEKIIDCMFTRLTQLTGID